ncbi:MAG: leucine-rich repeat protein, partial [Clostridia bacterium]|nr:leucine-rich repeat protein [Clostridia bacterium]
PGIVSLMVEIGYDARALELVNIEGGIFSGTAFGPLTKNPIAVNWFDTIKPNNTSNGVVATLTFKIKEDAPLGETAVTLSYDEENVYDFDFENVYFDTVDSVVMIECGHTYDNDSDTTCNNCGAVREVENVTTSGTTGDCTWTLDGTKLTISGSGAMGNYFTQYDEDYYSVTTAPWGASITEVVIEKGVTHLGDYAFEGCKNLSSVTLPEGLVTLGSDVFSHCTSLTSIVLPDSLTTIDRHAFAGCVNLTSIDIPDGVTKIDFGAFMSCSKLTSIVVPDSVTHINWYVFAYCANLTSVVLPEGITDIGGLFEGCRNLTSVNIPDSVTFIGDGSFADCRSLVAITIPDKVDFIGMTAFWNCNSLTSINIPDSVTFISDSAFYGCTNLLDVYYEGSEEERALVSIGEGNAPLISATWHYNSCMKNAETYEHTYDNDADATCNNCGAVREVISGPTFCLDTVKGGAGDTVVMTLSVKNNPGIVSLKVDVGYDANVLELVSIKGGILSGTSFGPTTSNPIAVNWFDTLNPDNTSNGTLATITFKIKEGTSAGKTAVTLSYDEENVYDFYFENVYFDVANGAVEIV